MEWITEKINDRRTQWCGGVGEEGNGWTYAKFLLANERVGNVDIAKFEHYLDELRKLTANTHEGGRPLSEDPSFKRRIAELEVNLATVKALMADQLAATREHGGAPTMMGAAALKLRGTEFSNRSCRPTSMCWPDMALCIRQTHYTLAGMAKRSGRKQPPD